MQDTDPAPAPPSTLTEWFRLEQAPGVGPLRAQALLAAFGSPAAIFAASFEALASIVPAGVARGLLAPPSREAQDIIARACDWAEQPGHALITPDDPRYSPSLRQIADPPLILYANGRAQLLAQAGLAVVGSRNATAQGTQNAQALAQAISSCGIAIVSGLALGIDTAAHEGGLRGEGATIAVIGTGQDVVYPARNRALAHRIAEQGCIVSEFPLGVHARATNFPRRNRIISGLSQAVLVVEAAAESGSLITAHCALDQGRDVLAVPGSIHAALSKGCNSLIRDGAKLVETAQDILHELRRPGLVPFAPQPFQRVDIHTSLFDLLARGPADPATLAALTGTGMGFVVTQLLALELSGYVERLPGGMFQRVAPAG